MSAQRSTAGVGASTTQQPRGNRFQRAARAAIAELFGSGPVSPTATQTSRDRSIARGAWQGADTSRFTLDWRTGNASADNDIRGALAVLRSRARDLARNNPYIERYLGLLNTNVISSDGFGHQPQVRGNGGKLEKGINDELKAQFKKWTESTVSVDGKLDFLGFQSLQLEAAAVDGESFTRRIIGRQFPHGLGLQPIDADLVAETVSRTLNRDGAEVRMGVEIDAFGSPVAYHCWDWPDYTPGSQGRGLQRYPASEMLHHYRMRRAHQTRGVTWLARTMVDVQDVAGYDEAVILGARAGANQLGFVEWSDAAAPIVNPGDDRTPRKYELNPATVTELDPGQHFNGFDPSQPHAVYSDFTRTILRRMASGLGISYESLSNDLSAANYSSARVGLMIERELWKLLQKWWVRSMLHPVYQSWLETAFLTGVLDLPGGDWRQYAAVKWVPRGWPWVDPKNDVEASEKELALGLNSHTRLAQERGRDFYELLEERAAEQEAADTAGVSIDGGAAAAAAAVAASPFGKGTGNPGKNDKASEDSAGDEG